ncbi:6-phosphofructo-2-kinase/fructose-2,6-bisphosphatase [Glycine soja]
MWSNKTATSSLNNLTLLREMGTGASKDADEGSKEERERLDHAGGQLYVSLKMENHKLTGDLVPHVYGSVPLVGSWDPSKALFMERESCQCGNLALLSHLITHSNTPCFVEEGPSRLLVGGALQEDARLALFRLDSGEVLQYQVFVKADRVSPFDLAASWRAYQDKFRPSSVRWIPDVSINSAPQTGGENGCSVGLELDLEHYVVPTPATAANSAHVYAANMTENPRSLICGSGSSSYPIKEMQVIVPDPSKMFQSSGMVESKSVGTFSPLQKQESQRGLFVDRGVGSPRLVKSSSSYIFSTDLNLDNETKNSMPAAAGAVAAAAVADQMLGPKEDRHLAIILVGLPARGKTFTAAKLTRYLHWLGHNTKHFNVGKYRCLKHGANQSADFFRADNPEGVEARNEVAALAFEDMISWMQEGGQVGIFDATNSSKERRNMLMKLAEGRCKVYETVNEGSYIKMIDMVSGHGGQIQVNNISGYLPGRIVFFLVNTHLTPRPILLTRHGESQDNVRGRRIGGDTAISEAGELYSKKLAKFVGKRIKSERAASIWTSTLQRTILTATPIVGFPKIQWRALDEINAGVSRKKDKLRYRYPRGESYLDVIQRLEPVIIELKRQRAPVVVISHQAVLRALYAYFADRPLNEIPHIAVPLHTIIEIQMGVTGVQEKRYKLMD